MSGRGVARYALESAVATLDDERLTVRTLKELRTLLRERRQAGQQVFPVRLGPVPGRGVPPLFAFTAKKLPGRAKEAFRRSALHTIRVEFCDHGF